MYLYANGLFKAKSTALLKKKDYQSLTEVDDDLFFARLRGFGFGFSQDIDDFYQETLLNLKKELLAAKIPLDAVSLFFYQDDLVNTKLYYKSIHYDIEVNKYILNSGNIKPIHLYNALKNKDYKGVNQATDLFRKINNLSLDSIKETDDMINKLYVEHIKNTIIYHPPLLDYLNTRLDLTNILTIIRGKTLDLAEKEVLSSIIVTPNIDLLKAKELLSLSKKDFADYLTKLGYDQVSLAVKAYLSDKNIEKLEKQIDQSFYDILYNHTFDSSGLGYIMMYVYQRLMEIKNIKVLFYNRFYSVDDLFLLR